jgi:nucleotide-binding universal stress UspA family protein
MNSNARCYDVNLEQSKMKNILVGTDLSERSDRAMDRAALIAKQMGGMLHVIYVVDDEVSSTIALACKENASIELQKQIKEGAFFKGVKTKVHIEFGHPWKKITELAEQYDADLVVLGAHRNRGLRELFSGTTLHRVAKVCKSPLLVAVNRATGTYKKVLVGVDFSECARHATDIASRIAHKHPLTLIHAYHIPFKALTMRADEHGDIIIRERKRIKKEIRHRMTDFISTLTGPHEDTHKIIKEGGPVAVLQAEAIARKADLVCVGSHGKSWLVEAVLGSTAYDLLSNPPCDVLIAPLR